MTISKDDARERMTKISSLVATWNALGPSDQVALGGYFFNHVREVIFEEVHHGK